jgi:hypothetical protein
MADHEPAPAVETSNVPMEDSNPNPIDVSSETDTDDSFSKADSLAAKVIATSDLHPVVAEHLAARKIRGHQASPELVVQLHS